MVFLTAAIFMAAGAGGCSAPAETAPASCPPETREVDGRCVKTCVDRSPCLVSETCVAGLCAVPPAGPVEILAFTALPTQVAAGERVRVGYSVANAVRVQLAVGGPDGISTLVLDSTERFVGFESTPPLTEDVTLALAATGGGGRVLAREIDIEVIGAEMLDISSLDISTGPVDPGHGAVVSWTTTGADRIVLRLNGANGPVLYESRRPSYVRQGQFVVLPIALGRSYTVEAFAGTDVVRRTVTIAVNPVPPVGRIASFGAVPEIFDRASTGLQEIELRWNGGPDDAIGFLRIDEALEVVPADGTLSERFAVDRTLVTELTVEADGGVDRAYGRIWGRRDEVGANANPAAAEVTDGLAIDGVMGPPDFEDWYQVRVQAGGSISVDFLDETDCPSSLSVELIFSGQTLQTGSNAGFRCPALTRVGLSGGTYRVRLKGGSDGVSFPYTVGIAADPGRCGDGRVTPDEECDDGNLTRGDGCDEDCVVEPAYHYGSESDALDDWTPVPDTAVALDWLPYVEDQAVEATDEGFAIVPLPFVFLYYGRTYRGLIVHADGFVSFLPELDGDDFDPRNAWGEVRPNALVAAFLADLRWPNGARPKVWTSNTGEPWGPVLWVDFGEAQARGEDRPIGQVRLGLSSTGLVVLLHGTLETGASFQAGVEDHTGTRRVSACGASGCNADRDLSNTASVFGSTQL